MTRADKTTQSRAANAYSPAVALAILLLRTTCDGFAGKSLPCDKMGHPRTRNRFLQYAYGPVGG